MTDRLTDAEAIIASWSDPSRFTAVFERHFAALHGYLARRVGSDLADDLAAETLVRAFDSRRRYDRERSDALPWLYGIAVRLLRQHYRSERRRLLAYAKTGVDPVEHDGLEAVDSRVDAGNAGPLLAGALAALSKGERDVLLLFAWADLSYSQISEALDLPLGTVRSRLSRARERVRRHLRSGPAADFDMKRLPLLGEVLLEARSEENG